jgi:tRNA dimethylallyltransferase
VARSPDHESPHTPVVAIVGATACGKSDLAMQLAESLPIAIVNADAMQLYRGMDIGTAKPNHGDRERVPHFGLDTLEVAEAASVADFRDHARQQIVAADHNRRPVVVGGSALYLRAVLDQLDIPPTDPVVRARLNAELAKLGIGQMYARLQIVAPQAAADIEPNNGRRIVRALEVVELTGSFRARLPAPVSWMPTLWLGLRWSRTELDQRIESRVEKMWAAGLVAEVESLLVRGLAQAPTASKAVGYRQVLQYFRGEITEVEAKASTVAATRKLARRQERTFRSNKRIHWLQPGPAAANEAYDLVQVFMEAL